MSIHDRAWSGMEICVFGVEPMTPMRIEQSIAAALPAIEVQVSSFERYEDAYQFCKQTGNVGLLIVSEQSGAAPFQSVFRELSEHAKNRNLPCFGVVVHSGVESSFAAKLVGKTPDLLDYVSISDLLSPLTASTLLEDIWRKYVTRFEEEYIPPALQASFTSYFEANRGADAAHFTARATTIIEANLNISWLEYVACRWEPFVTLLAKDQPSFLAPHERLLRICELARSTPISIGQLEPVLSSSQLTLPQKVNACVALLEVERRAGRIEQALEAFSQLGKPGAPAIFRTIKRVKETLKLAANDATSLAASNMKVTA